MGSLSSLSMLRMLSLHSNMLVTLQLEIASQAELESVTIDANRWQCVTACQWLHTWQKLDRVPAHQITCKDGDQAPQNMRSVMASCTDADPLPVSSNSSSSLWLWSSCLCSSSLAFCSSLDAPSLPGFTP